MSFLPTLARRGRDRSLRCRQQLRGKTLVVDCSACLGSGSLGDGRCLQAFLQAVPAHVTFQQVALRRLVEIRYQPGAALLLKGAADLLQEFEELHQPRSRPCRKCACRPAAAALRAALTRWGYPSPLPARPRGRKCASCAEIAHSVALEVDERLRAIESKALADMLITREG
jgi:hypothetical protein